MKVRVQEYVLSDLSAGGKSHKFWRVTTVPGLAVLYQYGRLGNKGQTSLDTGVARDGKRDKKIKEKCGKGYSFANDTSLDLPDYVPLTAGPMGDAIEDALNKQVTGEWGGVMRRGPVEYPRPRAGQEPSHDELDELLTHVRVTAQQPSLSQRAFSLMERAALNPEAALADFAILRAEVEDKREEVNEAEQAVRTLGLMLGLEISA